MTKYIEVIIKTKGQWFVCLICCHKSRDWCPHPQTRQAASSAVGRAPSHRWQPVKFDFRFQPSPKYLMNAKLSPKTNKRRPHNKWMGSYTKYNQVMFHAWLKKETV